MDNPTIIHSAHRPILGSAFLIFTLALSVLAGKLLFANYWRETQDIVVITPRPTPTATPPTSIEYHNTEYGFSVTLPSSWQGYTIKTQTWQARSSRDNYGKVTATGPEIHIVHPLSTTTSPRQDIPLMVLSLAQWSTSAKEDWSFGAAPIGPSELARNTRYAFLLPARYNYAFPTGFQEVERIIASKSVTTF
jgi:hypothetical protein